MASNMNRVYSVPPPPNAGQVAPGGQAGPPQPPSSQVQQSVLTNAPPSGPVQSAASQGPPNAVPIGASNPTPMVPAAMGPAAMGPAAMGPAALGPAALGPTAMGPNAMGPAAMGPAAMGPTAMGPAAMGPTTMGPAAMGPTTMGPNAMGPATMGPTAMGPTPPMANAPPPPGPGMRPPDRPMQMQHGPPPPSAARQYVSPAPGYQQPQRTPYPAASMQGTPPPPPQGMHSRVGQGMPPPPNAYSPGRMAPQGPMGSMAMDSSRKRPPPDRNADVRSQGAPPSKSGGAPSSGPVSSNAPSSGGSGGGSSKKKKKLADKILPQKVRDLVPESQAYMDLLAFERKLDFTIMRKRLDIQEALKRPMKQKRKLRIFISNTFYPGKPEGDGNEEPTVPSWELRVEGRLLDDPNAPKSDQNKVKRKFSSFFKSLVIELDKDLYGPDNHLVEWHRTPTTTETDGFQVKRPGDKNVRCTILLLLDYQPLQFKLDPRLARLLGIHTQTRPMIIGALWQYIKTHKLQDAHEREYINCDKYLEQIFQCSRMKFAEIPQRLHHLLHPADPIVINHVISVEGPDTKKTACYDIDVEVDDPLKSQMNNFLLSTASQQEIQALDNKIHETVETINQLKTNREFFLSFAKDPQQFINKWLISEMRDLKTMTDVVGNPEEERRSDFYYQPWAQEAVFRYFYGKVQQRRAELEQALGIRNT